jgi:hypothetical protein
MAFVGAVQLYLAVLQVEDAAQMGTRINPRRLRILLAGVWTFSILGVSFNRIHDGYVAWLPSHEQEVTERVSNANVKCMQNLHVDVMAFRSKCEEDMDLQHPCTQARFPKDCQRFYAHLCEMTPYPGCSSAMEPINSAYMHEGPLDRFVQFAQSRSAVPNTITVLLTGPLLILFAPVVWQRLRGWLYTP